MRARLLLSAPWLRAPLLLVRRPAVALAVAGASLILGVGAAATPLYISSSGNAALHRQLADACPWRVGPSATIDWVTRQHSGHASVKAAFQSVDHTVRGLGRGVPALGAPTATFISSDTPLRAPGGRDAAVNLVRRPGFLKHVDVVARGSGGHGVWLERPVARRLHVRPGDTIKVSSRAVPASGGALHPVRLPVAGIIRSLDPRKTSRYWCGLRKAIEKPPFSNKPSYPFALLDRPTYLRVADSTGLSMTERWHFPIHTQGLTTGEASATGGAVRDMLTATFRPGDRVFPALDVRANFPGIAKRARQVGSSVSSSIGPVAVAGVVVALLLMAAAGSFWADRRRAEIDLLVSRGVGPVALGLKAVLEMAVPLTAGTAGGWALALLLVTRLGPSPLLSAGAPLTGLAAAGGALVFGLLLVGLVAAVRTRTVGESRRGARRHWAARVPWELAFLAGAGVLLVWLLSGGSRLSRLGSGADAVARVDPLLLAFPLLFLAGAVAVMVRVFAPVIGQLAHRGRRASVPAFLAARRVGAAPRGTLVLLAATAIPIGVLVYAAALTGSVSSTLEAKAQVYAGSDISVLLDGEPGVPAKVRARTTPVVRLDKQALDDSAVTVFGVDPDTLPREIYWHSSYAGRPLGELMAAIDRRGAGGRVPVLATGDEVARGPATLHLDGPEGDQLRVPVTVVGTPSVFPGQRDAPVVVMDERALLSATHTGFTHLRARGDPGQVLSLLSRAGVPARGAVRASTALDAGNYLAVSYAFRFLIALALLIGVVGVVGLLLYLEARSRGRRVFYVLARRMGLTRRGHLGSLLVELGGLLAVGLAVGGGLAWLAVLTVYERLDVAPYLPPGPLLPVPVRIFVLVAVTVSVVMVVSALMAQRSVDRARAAEVLRAAE